MGAELYNQRKQTEKEHIGVLEKEVLELEED